MQPAPLASELEAWLVVTPLGLTAIKHPLVYAIPYHEPMNGTLNAQLAAKQKAVDEALRRRRWPSYIALHERPWRLQALHEVANLLRPRTYWSLLGEVYTDTENLWQNLDLWLELLHADLPDRGWLMDADERHTLKALPESLTVFRGFAYDEQEDGLSWTLDKAVACRFARHAYQPGDSGPPRVLEGRVARADVIAHFTGRGEQEVVALPEHVAVTVEHDANSGSAGTA